VAESVEISDEGLAKLVQGMFIGQVMKEDYPIYVRDVEQETNDQGEYLNSFVIVTRSGLRIRVTVELEESDG